MNGKQKKQISQTSSTESLSSKENQKDYVQSKLTPVLCERKDDIGSMWATSEGTPTFRTPLEAAMKQQQLQAQKGYPPRPTKTPMAVLCSRGQKQEAPQRPGGTHQVFQNLTNHTSSMQQRPNPLRRSGGMKAAPFDFCAHSEEVEEGEATVGRPSVSTMAYKPAQHMSMPAAEQAVQVEGMGSNVVAYAERGILVDQHRPILLIKRQQITPRGSENYDQGSLASGAEGPLAQQTFSQGMWPPNTGFISQGGDSSSGYVSSDQERVSIFSQAQSRGMNSDDVLHNSQPFAYHQGVGDLQQKAGILEQGRLGFQNADQSWVKHADGDQQQPESKRRGSSTTASQTGTRTTGGTTYNSECSSPKGGAGLSFSNQAGFGPLAGNNAFVYNDQRQLLDLQNQAMLSSRNQAINAAAMINNDKPPLSPCPKQAAKFKNQPVDLQKQQDQPFNDPESAFMSPPIEKMCKVPNYMKQKPFQISLIHNPRHIENEQNIVLDAHEPLQKEDKQFFQDLQVIQSANKPKIVQRSLKKSQNKKGNNVQSGKKSQAGAHLSQDGNRALSFKSVTSYVLGDLDISNGEASSELGSFEISSNTSSIHSEVNEDLLSDKKDRSSKRRDTNPALNKKAKCTKKFQEDDELNHGYLANEAYQGFIAEKSPFSFKNPIFFSCPNSKFAMKRRINTNELQSKRQLFVGKKDAQVPVHGFQQNAAAMGNVLATEPDQINTLQTRICEIPQINNIPLEQSQPPGPLFYNRQNEFVQEAEPAYQSAILKRAQDRINQNLEEIKTLQILQKKVLDGGSQQVHKGFQQQLRPAQAHADGIPAFHGYEHQVQDLQMHQQKPFLTPVISRHNPRYNKPLYMKTLDLQKVKPDFPEQQVLDTGCVQYDAQQMSKRKIDPSSERRLKYDSVESPNSKMKYKAISKIIDELEKSEATFKDLVQVTLGKIQSLEIPRKTLWRIFLDLADYAKRESKFDSARQLYKIVVCNQPFAYQGWLEYAKMEEECGNQEESNQILLKSLKFNQLNENLFVKVVKYEEKKNNIQNIRALVDSVKRSGDCHIEQIWRVLLEGALCEGRLGYREEARRQFQYLMLHCKNNGAVFLDASRFEEREDQIEEAINVCEQGLQYNVKHTPLWFQYLKLYEKADDQVRSRKFDKLCYIVKDMFRNIGKDYHWKINIELAQTFDRLGDEQKTKEYLALVATDCPDSVKWKIWLIAARLMQNQGHMDQARLCIERSCMEVPLKQISISLLEYAKYFEMVGENERALEIMQRVRTQSNAEWKIQFEAVMMFMRMGKFQDAEAIVKESLKSYFAKGRLWAVLIQLQHQRACTQQDFQEVHTTFKQAVNEISKSGEVWCEGARLCLTNHVANPYFDIQMALKYLDFAVQFTPQYGDSFLEVVRACLMLKKMKASDKLPKAVMPGEVDPDHLLQKTHLNCLHSEPNYGVLWFYYKSSMIDNAIDIWKNARAIIQQELDDEFEQPASQGKATNWLGSTRLNLLMENGMKIASQTASNSGCTYEEKIRVVYGFEQILPQNSSKKGEN